MNLSLTNSTEANRKIQELLHAKDVENVKLREQLAVATETCIDWQNAALAAEAKLKALSEQEPVGYLLSAAGRMPDFHYKRTAHPDMLPIYSAPVPTVDVQELQAKLDTAIDVLAERDDKEAW